MRAAVLRGRTSFNWKVEQRRPIRSLSVMTLLNLSILLWCCLLNYAVVHAQIERSVWRSVPMPEKSHFAGIPAPTDPQRWKRAAERASTGEQVLLKKVAKAITSPFDYLRHDDEHRSLTALSSCLFVPEDSWITICT